MPILIDFSGTVHAAVYVDIRINKETSKDYLRYIIINQIRSIRKKFIGSYGEPIICMDSRCGYWRKDQFPFYKQKRKEAREASSIDWHTVFSYVNEIAEEIKENLPYKVLCVDKAEADDIIGTLTIQQPWKNTENFNNNELCLIVSNDHDFKQLHVKDSVKQYFPHAQRIECVNNPNIYLIEQILKGDPGDGIPNVRSQNDIFVLDEKKRQLPVTTKYIKRVLETRTVPESDKARLCENAMLIDLRNSPEYIKTNIIEQYNNAPCGNRSNLFIYFTKHDMNFMLNRISDF